LTPVDGARESFKDRDEGLTVLAVCRIEKYKRKSWDTMTHDISFGPSLDIKIFTGKEKKSAHFIVTGTYYLNPLLVLKL
jgi:hypothetical protein